ncbi:hypothetical protein vseg_016658 [Gypsophila vaccaria]
MGVTSITQGLSRETSQDVKKSPTENKGKTNGILSRNDMRFSCLPIMEPEESPEAKAYTDAHIASVLATFQESLNKKTPNFGYATTDDFDYRAMGQLMHNHINNFGDPFTETSYKVHSKQFEVGVLDWFARLWELENHEYWGYITNGGSEGNLHGILLGRELFPDGIFYTSKDSHFSIFKAARMYRMECVTVDSLFTGEIDCSDLKTQLLRNKDKPAILCLNFGTTMKGAIDDLDLVIHTLEECGFQEDRFYIHCDGAMYGLMLPLLKDVAPKITFKKPIGSISVSGHKFIGCPTPCGILMTRIKHIKVLSRDVEYIASRDATITCSRNGHSPIFLWCALTQKGYAGFRQNYERCLRNAKYLKDKLKEAGFSVMRNELSSTVVFERPRDTDFILRWQLACEGDMTHVIVLPCHTIENLDAFFRELLETRSRLSRNGAYQPPCVAHHIGKINCVCNKHITSTIQN